jgi:prepilin-type N-terminal cleavage/methylation domain-containing protein
MQRKPRLLPTRRIWGAMHTIVRNARRRLRGESGFTLLEVLIVVVIIGILGGIALAMFTTQKDKAHDADAKSNASGLAAAMKSCYVETSDYNDCDGSGANDKLGSTGLPMGPGAGQVSVNVTATDSFVVTAISKATNGGGTHKYMVSESSGGALTRTCSVGSGNNGGGCNAGKW